MKNGRLMNFLVSPKSAQLNVGNKRYGDFTDAYIQHGWWRWMCLRRICCTYDGRTPVHKLLIPLKRHVVGAKVVALAKETCQHRSCSTGKRFKFDLI